LAGSGDSWSGLKATYRTLGPAGRLAAVAGVLCVGILVISLWKFSSSILSANTPAAAGGSETKDQVAAHDALFGRYTSQFNGRSLFIVPGAPTPPAPPPPPTIAEETKPQKPTSYEGSAVIAMVVNSVWFADGKRLSVGDEPKDDTEVLEVQAPWDAVLRWKGEKFTVSLFARDKLIIKPEEKKPDEASPGDQKPDVVTAAAPTKATDPAKPDVSKPETKPETKPEIKLADKPTPKPDKAPEPKSDAAPGTPGAAPQPGDNGPEPDSQDNTP
jgi:hypothetical protein